MTQIAPIPTIYNGVTFRSRTEARWAVFFDALGLPWTYEPEGFSLPSGSYLPDFLLHLAHGKRSVWFEVKGQSPTEREIAVAIELADATGRPVFLAVDRPRMSFDIYSAPWTLTTMDCENAFTRCVKCGAVDCVFLGKGDRIAGECISGDHERNGGDSIIQSAIDSARAYSFWNPPR